MKRLLILSALAVGLTAGAQTYIETNFSSGIPSDFTLVNGDGQPVREATYRNIGKNAEVAWVAGSLPGMGRAALSPTLCAADIAQDNLMILPAVTVESSGCILRFDARSLYPYIREAYSVLARTDADDEWQTIYSNDAESPYWTKHLIRLDNYQGKSLQLAFQAHTRQGFMLAIDNIFVGVPTASDLVFENGSMHYVGVNDKNKVRGIISNYGAKAESLTASLDGFGDAKTFQVPALEPGEQTELEWEVNPAVGEVYNYTIRLAGSDTVLCSDFMSCSHFARNQVIDRCSGTWCNNCPAMEIPLLRLARLYGSQLTVVEPHINDRLACMNYNNPWITDNVFSIPALIPNHDLSLMVYKLSASDNFSGSLAKETVAGINAAASQSETGEISVNAEVRFAGMMENSSDRYRVAYLLMGDYHDPERSAYRQVCSAMNYNDDVYYYMESPIGADLTYFENVPVEGSVAYTGVTGSLPADLQADEVYRHSYRFTAEGFTGNALRVLAMVVDTQTGLVMNSCVADPNEDTAVTTITDEPYGAKGTEYYDLTGRRLRTPLGLCIERRNGKTRKTILH